MRFHFVSTLGEVLALSLRGASLHEGSLIFPEAGVSTPAGRFPAAGPLLNRGLDAADEAHGGDRRSDVAR